MNKIQYIPIQYKGQNRIQVIFEKNDAWNQRMKQVHNAKWSKTLRSWHIPGTPLNRSKCKLPLNTPALIPGSVSTTSKTALLHLSENNKEQMQLFLQQLYLKAYTRLPYVPIETNLHNCCNCSGIKRHKAWNRSIYSDIYCFV